MSRAALCASRFPKVVVERLTNFVAALRRAKLKELNQALAIALDLVESRSEAGDEATGVPQNRRPADPRSLFFYHQGAVAQLGEHLLCKQGVTGSIPVRSTKPKPIPTITSRPSANSLLLTYGGKGARSTEDGVGMVPRDAGGLMTGKARHACRRPVRQTIA